jgi:tetratricopeptide (TPR) repeat protein
MTGSKEDVLKLRSLVSLAAAAVCLAWAGTALARNPHCAGGIQYVVQGLKDKERGNTEDYAREMLKAVDQLTMCSSEDSADFEAMGYLGWALAEIDSAGPAGAAFQKAAAEALAKGDKKKIEGILANRDHYWSIAYNEGIKNIQDGQQLADADAKAEAHDAFAKAITALTRAKLLRPGHAQTLRNLATAFAMDNDFDRAETVLRNGQTEAARDTSVRQLDEALRTVRANKAGALLTANKFEEAVAYYTDLTQQEPGNADLWNGMGNAHFKLAETRQDAARKAEFKSSGDAYAKAYQLKSDDANLVFNAALAYQYAGELPSAEAQWRLVLVKTPNDADALSSLGSVLADEKKFEDATRVLLKAISIKPEEKVYYRQLGAVYSKAGNNPKSTEMLIVYMAMSKGTTAADPVATAKAARAGSAAANTLAAMGSPDKVLEWDDTTGSGKLQTWVYVAKQLAFTYNTAGLLVQKSDWAAAKK